MDLGPVELKEGDNVLRFIAAEKGDIAVDRFTLSPQVDRIAMVGDSITHMGDWKTVLGRNDVVNWGIPGYTTGQIEWTFKDLVQQESGLKVVFLEGGINDLTLGVPPNVVYENEIRAIAYWRKRGVMPILQSIIFKVDSPETNAVIADLNARLREYCGAEHVDYVDLNAVLSDSKGLRADLSIDGTHLNPPAYELWAGEIRKTLDRLKL
jgi:alpha-glucosidase